MPGLHYRRTKEIIEEVSQYIIGGQRALLCEDQH